MWHSFSIFVAIERVWLSSKASYELDSSVTNISLDEVSKGIHLNCTATIGSRPSDHYFRSVCLSVCLFVCAEFFSAVFDPILIKLGHVICLGLVVSPRI